MNKLIINNNNKLNKLNKNNRQWGGLMRDND